MRGGFLALATVIVWSILNVVTRFCLLQYSVSMLVFTGYMLVFTGIGLLLIRAPLPSEHWKTSVRYSWLYIVMQILENLFMVMVLYYITVTSLSLLFNLEIVITLFIALFFFRRKPRWGDYLGTLLILFGSILYMRSFPQKEFVIVVVFVVLGALASCVRSVVVEWTTLKQPEITVRQKCGVSGYTLFIGGLVLLFLLVVFAGIQEWGTLFREFEQKTVFYLPDFSHLFDYRAVVSGALAGFFINSLSVYLFYATLQWTTSLLFMAVRSFKPLVSFGLEFIIGLFYVAMRPEMIGEDYLLGGVILLGTVIILLAPMDKPFSKWFITR